MSAAIEIVVVDCPLCGGVPRQVLESSLQDIEYRRPGLYEVSRCSGCGFVYLSRRPDDVALLSCYPEDYHVRLDRGRNPLIGVLFDIKYRLRERQLDRWVPAGPRSLLEIGCGDAKFLVFLEERRWRPEGALVGVDFTVNHGHLPPGSRVKLIDGDIITLALGENFDAVVMYDVLEHLSKPIETLRSVARAMNSGAVLLGRVPDWDSPWRRIFSRYWQGLHVPRHLNFFDQASLTRLLEDSGFAVERIETLFDPGDFAVSFCNWITEALDLSRRSRKAWFFMPIMILGSPILLFQIFVLRQRCELGFVARKK